MVYTVLALKVLGYAEDDERVRWAEKQVDDLIIEENRKIADANAALTDMSGTTAE